MTKGQRVALYVRVSTDGQTVENQTRELQDVADRHHWHVVSVFADPGVSGMKEKRPGFDKLLQAVARKGSRRRRGRSAAESGRYSG